MSQWLEVKLGDYVNLLTGFPFKSKNYSDFEEDIKLLRGDNIAQGYLRWENVKRWKLTDDPRESNYFLKTNDVILAMDRPWIEAGLKYSIISNKDLPCLLVQRVACLRAKEILNQQFLRYVIGSKSFTEYVCSIETGTAVPHISGQQIKDYEFLLPPLPEQKAIASVLSSLDDKIDLLHRQNKTLEAMAETLFRQWFIEEAKEDWGEADLMQLIELQSGYAFKSKDFKESGSFGVIKIKNISGNIIDIGQTDFVADEVGLATAQRFHVKSGQVLVAMTGAEIGKLGLVPKTTKQLLLNQRVGLLVPRFKGAEYLAYLHLKSEFGQDYIENSATGSAQPNISGSLIEACPFPKLDNEFLRQCGMQVQIYYEKVKENLGQIQTLENLRDTLLPKLMNGEVRVQYQTQDVA
ncbi:restriction endonuclease subunit S [Acinetobacter soli]|uniref:restriction endonuclease subunit S n=1 Tax=Acinetobacter soli TaxID=487316 RepID=UPI00124C67E2|nr:restriction endonuclease subunit S [Acinetobacter soli]MDQ8943718.1 restriction endonuclease subunit S [Acinetobacter soli]